ncbi:O-antigen ligase-like membrane protein [Humitalea rosea]|uniref:O-antigen ligase-like membrane protein n=1 Tax=Humitalea rosea TaxID=990373 RepID=A0A2W7IJI4_9PROT|nr:O-antigen ligase family protein [Humitalea rosea]PZW38683.1 O-antigen ligase-like membrane protein [Humitalea rosea]
MTVAAVGQVRRATLGDHYIRMLAFGLLGYAVLGKGFAYVGVAPLFVGEVLFGLGLLVLLSSGCLLATFTSAPNLLLGITCCWVLARTAPYVGTYGVDALRDSVVIIYGVFAMIMCGLLIEQPRRINDLYRLVAVFTTYYGPWAWTLYFFSKVTRNYGPYWPGSGLPMVLIRPGEVAVHVAASTVFALLFLPKFGLVRMALIVMSIAAVSAQSRGGMLSIALPVAVAAFVAGTFRQIIRMAAIALSFLAIAYALQIEVSMDPDNRVVSAEQLVLNVASLFGGAAGEGDLDGTKLWRLRWWEAIQGYTIHGPLFWSGHGFGMNLAEEDGFVVGLEHGGPVVRSPHNASMTILARAGVPGLVLWLLLLASWYWMMLSNILLARRQLDPGWANWFLFLGCYLGSILIDASFDVALEGPMLGIWFWAIFGVGTGSAMVFRARGRLS